MRTENYGFIPLFWINVLLSVLVGLNLSQFISRKIAGTVLHRWLLGIGRDSIVYVCLNQLVIRMVSKLCKQIPLLMAQSQWIVKTAVLILTLTILWGCSQILTRTKLRILIGKRL
jgi:Ca2+/Na+ antiporter